MNEESIKARVELAKSKEYLTIIDVIQAIKKENIEFNERLIRTSF